MRAAAACCATTIACSSNAGALSRYILDGILEQTVNLWQQTRQRHAPGTLSPVRMRPPTDAVPSSPTAALASAAASDSEPPYRLRLYNKPIGGCGRAAARAGALPPLVPRLLGLLTVAAVSFAHRWWRAPACLGMSSCAARWGTRLWSRWRRWSWRQSWRCSIVRAGRDCRFVGTSARRQQRGLIGLCLTAAASVARHKPLSVLSLFAAGSDGADPHCCLSRPQRSVGAVWCGVSRYAISPLMLRFILMVICDYSAVVLSIRRCCAMSSPLPVMKPAACAARLLWPCVMPIRLLPACCPLCCGCAMTATGSRPPTRLPALQIWTFRVIVCTMWYVLARRAA